MGHAIEGMVSLGRVRLNTFVSGCGLRSRTLLGCLLVAEVLAEEG